MFQYITSLEAALQRRSNPENAAAQKAYMRNQFEFYGLKATQRRMVQQPFLAKNKLPSKEMLPNIVKTLWEKPHREFQLIGQELTAKYRKQIALNDIELYEYMVTHKSWWDTVDFIAANLMGTYFKTYTNQQTTYVEKWLDSENIWLQRSALLFQLKYKEHLDTDLLRYVIHRLLGSNEFFINKAIGWVLREYGKTNPIWVENFVHKNQLHPLSQREALRIIKSNK